MTLRRQRLFMIACVATALAADRVCAAAPVLRPQIIDVARTITRRLVVSFRQVVPAARMRHEPSESPGVLRALPVRPARQPLVLPFDSSPAEYRLPPPLI
jgi:hypothetical protein